MREYETTFIIQPEISEEGVEAFCARLDTLLENQGSIRLIYDDQGRRRMAYEIKNFQKGRYVSLQYMDSGAVVPELERALRLDESILRFLTVQVNDEVVDVEARKAEAVELERVRAEKAAERAAREAEDAAREAEEAERARVEAAKAAEAKESAAAEAAKAGDAADTETATEEDGSTPDKTAGDADAPSEDGAKVADDKSDDEKAEG